MVLKRHGELYGRLAVGPKLFQAAAGKVRAKEGFQHAPRVGSAGDVLSGLKMLGRIEYMLRHGDENLPAEQSDGLEVLLISGRRQPSARFFKLAVNLGPAGRLNGGGGPGKVRLRRAKDRSPRDLADLD
jgi:hypothetical protein